MYKLQTNKYSESMSVVVRLSDGACIPFDNQNTDYSQFKKDILDGAELLDADGEVMPNAIDFVNTLP